jgi:signal transduction histidine kinase
MPSAEEVTVAHLFAMRQRQDIPDVRAVAHDLNNLLTAISGYASLVVTNEHAPADVQRDAREIADAATQAARLVRGLQQSG